MWYSLHAYIASSLRKQLRRVVSKTDQPLNGERMPPRSRGRGQLFGSGDEPSEDSRLLPAVRSHILAPVSEDGPIWARIPKKTWNATRDTLISNYVNILLVFVPLGIIAGAVGWNPSVVFMLNFLAIIPLASLLSFATEELSAKLGQTIGGLLNATFGNAVELIVGDPL